jgi:RNA polymerase sigma-70 factor (ECF subfamily)
MSGSEAMAARGLAQRTYRALWWGRGAGEPDERLLAAVAGGDSQALTELYERYAGPLFGFLVRLAGDRTVAEEILQDTLLAVWRSAASYGGRSSVRTWLFGVARRQAHNRLRTWRSGSRPPTADLDEAGDPPEPGPGPEEQVLAAADAAMVTAALDRLAAHHREVLVLAFVADLPQAEIAAVLGVPVGTVKSRLHHAKAALAAILRDGQEEPS